MQTSKSCPCQVLTVTVEGVVVKPKVSIGYCSQAAAMAQVLKFHLRIQRSSSHLPSF